MVWLISKSRIVAILPPPKWSPVFAGSIVPASREEKRIFGASSRPLAGPNLSPSPPHLIHLTLCHHERSEGSAFLATVIRISGSLAAACSAQAGFACVGLTDSRVCVGPGA